jgi:hypothetical protein
MSGEFGDQFSQSVVVFPPPPEDPLPTCIRNFFRRTIGIIRLGEFAGAAAFATGGWFASGDMFLIVPALAIAWLLAFFGLLASRLSGIRVLMWAIIFAVFFASECGVLYWHYHEPDARNLFAWITKGSKLAEEAPRPVRPHSPTETCAKFSGNAGIDTYCASSVLEPQSGNTYGVQNLFSSNDAIAWVHGTHKTGIGQWIVVEFDGLRSVSSITIRNGYQKNMDVYKSNSRVKELRLVFSQGESKVVSIEDGQDEQAISINPAIRAYWIQFRIEDVFSGTRWPDTAISKLLVISQPADR